MSHRRVGPQQVVRQVTGHTVGIQKGPDAPIVFIHVDDLKLCPAPRDVGWTPGPSTAKSLCASTVAFRLGSHISETISTPSVDVSTWNNSNAQQSSSDIRLKLDYYPIDLTGHILSPFFIREFVYQGCRFHSIAHLMCYRYAVLQGLKTFANGIRKWVKHLTDFPTPRFQTPDWQVQCRSVLTEIYSHLCLTDMAVKTALIDSGPRPFTLHCFAPWGALHGDSSTALHGNLISDILVEMRVHLVAGKLTSYTHWAEACCSVIGCSTSAWSYIVAGHVLFVIPCLPPTRECAV